MKISSLASLTPKASLLASKETERLKQYSKCSCLVIFGLRFPKDQSSETTVEITNSVKDILINQLQIDPDELNMELDKVHRLRLSSTKIQQRKQY